MRYKYLLLRRSMQFMIMFLFIAGNTYGWHLLRGNLSSSEFLSRVPLTDPFAALQISATGRLLSFEAFLGALIVTLFFAVVGGRAFCGWVCPMNVVTDSANWLRGKVRLDPAGRSDGISRNTRYWVAGISIILSVVSGVAAFEWISPVSILHRGLIYGFGLGWTAVLGVFLFDFAVLRNGFCGHVCPLGGMYSLIGKFGVLRVAHSVEPCTYCGKCLDICPEKQVLHMVGKRSGFVTSGECTNCGRCIEVCDCRAMRFGARYFSVKNV